MDNEHYAMIDGNALTCDMGQHEPNSEEQLWFNPLDTDDLLVNLRYYYDKLQSKITVEPCPIIADKLYSLRLLTSKDRDYLYIVNIHLEKHQRVV